MTAAAARPAGARRPGRLARFGGTALVPCGATLLLCLLTQICTAGAFSLRKTELTDCWTLPTPPLFDHTQLTFCVTLQPTLKPACHNLPSSILVSVGLKEMEYVMETTLSDFDYTKTREICVSCPEETHGAACAEAIMLSDMASLTISSINYVAFVPLDLAMATLVDNSKCFYADASVVKLVPDEACPYVEVILARSLSMCQHWNSMEDGGDAKVTFVELSLLAGVSGGGDGGSGDDEEDENGGNNEGENRGGAEPAGYSPKDANLKKDEHARLRSGSSDGAVRTLAVLSWNDQVVGECQEADTYVIDQQANQLRIRFHDLPQNFDILEALNLANPYAAIHMKAEVKALGEQQWPGRPPSEITMDIEMDFSLAYIVSHNFWDCYHNAKALLRADGITFYIAKGAAGDGACSVPDTVSYFTHTMTMWPAGKPAVDLSKTLSSWAPDPSLRASDFFTVNSAMQEVTRASNQVYVVNFSCYANTGRTTTVDRAAATKACLEALNALQKGEDTSAVSLQIATLGSAIGSSTSSERTSSVATVIELDCLLGGQAVIVSSGVCLSPAVVSSEGCLTRKSGVIILRVTEADAKTGVYDAAVHGYFRESVELDNTEAQLRYTQLETLGPDAPRYCFQCSGYQGANCRDALHRAFTGQYRLSFNFVDEEYTPTLGASETGEDLSTGWVYLSRVYYSDYTASLGAGLGLCAAVVFISGITGGVLMLQVRKQKKILRDLKRRERRGERKARRAAEAARAAQAVREAGGGQMGYPEYPEGSGNSGHQERDDRDDHEDRDGHEGHVLLSRYQAPSSFAAPGEQEL